MNTLMHKLYFVIKTAGLKEEILNSLLRLTYLTRKPSYHKDDRAMRPMYGCPETFRESLTTPIPKIFNGLLFLSLIHI